MAGFNPFTFTTGISSDSPFGVMGMNEGGTAFVRDNDPNVEAGQTPFDMSQIGEGMNPGADKSYLDIGASYMKGGQDAQQILSNTMGMMRQGPMARRTQRASSMTDPKREFQNITRMSPFGFTRGGR
jgi:hypothetical protein